MSPLIIVLALILPPVAVYLRQQQVNRDLVVNLVLTLLGLVPGIVHAFWLLGRKRA